jgi:regulator of ribonuclease activity A
MRPTTCDLSDHYGDQARIVAPVFKHFGGKRAFKGLVATIKCFEDNSRVKELTGTKGNGRVLLVDGGGSTRYALLGDMIANEALRNDWAGVIVHASVRDTAALAELEIGIMALAPCPRRSLKNGEGQMAVPIDLAGTRATPADFVFADGDGVILVDSTLLREEDRS